MNHLTRSMMALAVALPLAAAAQTAAPSSTSPSTPSSLNTAPSPNIKPADATTSGKNTGNENAGGSMSRSKRHKTSADKSKEGAPVGELSTYPAPTRDGKPTSPSTTK